MFSQGQPPHTYCRTCSHKFHKQSCVIGRSEGHRKNISDTTSDHKPELVSILSTRLDDDEEARKRKARKLRFTHPPVQGDSTEQEDSGSDATSSDAVDVYAATPSPRGATTVFSHDTGARQLILCVKELHGDNKGLMVTPGGGIEEGETPKQGAVRENAEEVAQEFGDALRNINSHEHAAVFKGTWIYFVPVSQELYGVSFAPTQPIPETSQLAWFDTQDLAQRAPGSSHAVEDTNGVWHTISRYALGVISAVTQAGCFKAFSGGAKAPKTGAKRPAKGAAERANKHPKAATAPATVARRPLGRAACTTGLSLLAAVAADADGELPLMGQAPKYKNEIVLPPPPGYEWPIFDQVCFHEHSLALVMANYEAGSTACSVADRRATRPPPPGCVHYYGKDDHFLSLYPHPIGRSSSHVTCAPTCYANWSNWEENVRNGSILHSAKRVLRFYSIGNRATAEQPPTCIARLIGEPTFKITAEELGGTLHKTLWFWTRNLDVVRPTHPEPKGVLNLLGQARCGTPEETMLRRSAFEPIVARSLMNVWATQDPWSGFTSRPANEPCPEHAFWQEQLLHNYSIFAARYAPQLTHQQLEAAGDVDIIIVVPITTVDEQLCVLAPLG